MKITATFKRRVIQLASEIREHVNSWSEALKASWKITRMFFGMKVSFVFEKVDKVTGEMIERPATAIAIGSLKTIKKGFVRFLEEVGDRTQWRSFRIERLILN